MFLDQFDPQAYLQSATGDPADGNRFFQPYLNHFKNPWDVVSTGRLLLHKCHNTDPLAYNRIYKGWIYFYLGLASFLLQDYEIALFFIDNAVASDLQAKFDPVNKTSHAMRFVQIDSSLQELRDGNLSEALGFYKDVEARIAAIIQIYNARTGAKNLNLTELRKNFLQPAMTSNRKSWETLATTFISFCLEWNYRDQLFTLCPEPSTSEPYFLHLFKGCLLFESLLKNNPNYPHRNQPKPQDIKSTLEQELKRLLIPLGHDKSKLKISGITLSYVVNRIDHESDCSLPTAMQYTGWLRNTLGHNLGWGVSLNKTQYQRLFEMVASSCIHVIACLYE